MSFKPANFEYHSHATLAYVKPGTEEKYVGNDLLLGQTMGAALVALVFGYAAVSGGTSPSIAILVAAGFSGVAAVASLSRLLRFVRMPRAPRTSDSKLPAAPQKRRTWRLPR